MKTFMLCLVLMCTSAFAGENKESLTTIANTDEGKLEIKTYPAEMCQTRPDTKKPCGTYLEFYSRKSDIEAPELVRSLTYNEFLNLFDSKPKTDKKGSFWGKLFKGIGSALLSVLKIFVPGVGPVVELAKVAFDAAGKSIGGVTDAPLGQTASVSGQSVVD